MNKFKHYFLYIWHYYVLYAFFVIMFWLLLFGYLAAPNKNEKLNFFIAAYFVETEKLEQDLSKNLKKYNVKRVDVDFLAPDNQNFNYVFTTRGLVGTDIIILNESKLPSTDYARYFISLDVDILSNYLPKDIEYRYLYNNGKIYGISIYDSAYPNINFLSEYISYTIDGVAAERYYLLFNKSSVNLGALGNHTSDKALWALRMIMGGI